jgi:hypothetical protein
MTGGSFVGALLPLVNLELIIAEAARRLGGGVVSGILVALIGAVGIMAWKLRVYLVARAGGRTLGAPERTALLGTPLFAISPP